MNDLGNKGYLVFGLILFVWELLPTTLLPPALQCLHTPAYFPPTKISISFF